jgi:hypothetical protein
MSSSFNDQHLMEDITVTPIAIVNQSDSDSKTRAHESHQSSLTSAHHPSQTDTCTVTTENDEMDLRDDHDILSEIDDVKTQQSARAKLNTLSMSHSSIVNSKSKSHEPDDSWKTILSANTSALLDSRRRSCEISRKLFDIELQTDALIHGEPWPPNPEPSSTA